MDDFLQRMHLRAVINAAGTMTRLGASAATPEAIRAASEILPRFIDIDELQRCASRSIAAATGAEAGFVTACASSAVTLAIAGAMTGADLDRIASLPDSRGMQDRIVVQKGHLIDYGAPIEQAVRLAGASVVPLGEAARAETHQLEQALDGTIAAGLYVVSHHTEQRGQIPLAAFVDVCTRRHVPVIVDAASEYDLTGFIAAGADAVIYSAHKFLRGLTAGILAGKKELVRAAYLQSGGVGRGMKVGKEGIAGAIAALEAWSKRDHAAHARSEAARVALWRERLAGVDGLRVELSPDPTGNPITRLRVHVGAAAQITAWDLADALARRDRPIMVRDDDLARGYFELDPCNLSDAEAEEVAEGILAVMARKSAWPPARTYPEWQARRTTLRLAWPDRLDAEN